MQVGRSYGYRYPRVYLVGASPLARINHQPSVAHARMAATCVPRSKTPCAQSTNKSRGIFCVGPQPATLRILFTSPLGDVLVGNLDMPRAGLRVRVFGDTHSQGMGAEAVMKSAAAMIIV